MASNPNLAATINAVAVTINTANALRDGTGTITNVLTAGAAGSRIDTVRIVAQGTTTAGVVRLFVHDGTTARLLDEILIPANTPSVTNPVVISELSDMGLLLKPGQSLRASTHNAEAFNVIVKFAGDF